MEGGGDCNGNCGGNCSCDGPEEAVGQRRLRRQQGRGNGGGDKSGDTAGARDDSNNLADAMSYVAEQYYLANSGNILASFLASVYTNKLFVRQICRLVFVDFTCANTVMLIKVEAAGNRGFTNRKVGHLFFKVGSDQRTLAWLAWHARSRSYSGNSLHAGHVVVVVIK
jgi:hypothetical protein